MNKIKFLLGILLLMVLLPLASSQSTTERRGVRYYELYNYQKAINHLERITLKSTDVLRMLADSYFKTGRYRDSESTYADLVRREDRIPEDLYQYAYILAINGKYSESRRWMENFASLQPNDSRAKRHLFNPYFYRELTKDIGQFTIRNLEFNNEQSDFAPAFFENRIVFTSSRALPGPFRRLWSGNNLPFLNLFVATPDEEGQFTSIEVFDRGLNKKFHDGPASFARDGTFMAFTRNNYDAASSDGVVKFSIYTSRRQDTRWSEPEPFPHNSNEYSVGHPALTPDGRTMFFASDMPGGYGGVDIYVSRLGTNGQWSQPKNLGPAINTEGDEMFPFFHPNGYLFFASDGLPGLGGLDVFYTNVADTDNPSQPINLGAPINGNADDFAFIIDRQMKRGYFSSNRSTGKGKDDIYSFEMHFPLRKIIRGTTLDGEQNILADVNVNLLDAEGKVLQTTTSSSAGTFEFYIDRNIVYRLEAVTDGFFKSNATANATTGQTEIVASIELLRIPQFSVYGIISDALTDEPLEGVRVRMVNHNVNQTYNITTTARGDFRMDLAGINLNDEVSLTFYLEQHSYVPRIVSFKQTVEAEGQIDLHEKIDLTLKQMAVGDDLGRLLGLGPITFDSEDTDVSSAAAKELDRIVDMMNEYPEMEIELGSHTDCRGSAAYNLRMSIIRAQAATWYIQARISNPNRIYGMGYGEFRPFINCTCEGASQNRCTEEQLLQNRRTEFVILRIDLSEEME